jgi:3-deoxy-D-manno-octulosonate 8-phosphate phosphatase (KDO 8-P phosphatase)
MIRLIVFDIDGTLTSGLVHLNAEGEEEKHFSIADGYGFRFAEESGLIVAVISGRSSKSAAARLKSLSPTNVLLGVRNKAAALSALQADLGISVAETAFVGDDINDLPAFELAGIKIAVANAAPQVKRKANYITSRPGGLGAGREAIEWILRRQNALEAATTKYLERELSHG